MEQKSEGRADSFVQAGTSLLVYRQILEPLVKDLETKGPRPRGSNI